MREDPKKKRKENLWDYLKQQVKHHTVISDIVTSRSGTVIMARMLHFVYLQCFCCKKRLFKIIYFVIFFSLIEHCDIINYASRQLLL